MIPILLALLLIGCVHRVPKEIDIETTCLVKENSAEGLSDSLDHRVICDDGTVIILPGVIPVGAEVVYDSYYENDDSTTIHGYVKEVREMKLQ